MCRSIFWFTTPLAGKGGDITLFYSPPRDITQDFCPTPGKITVMYPTLGIITVMCPGPGDYHINVPTRPRELSHLDTSRPSGQSHLICTRPTGHHLKILPDPRAARGGDGKPNNWTTHKPTVWLADSHSLTPLSHLMSRLHFYNGKIHGLLVHTKIFYRCSKPIHSEMEN